MAEWCQKCGTYHDITTAGGCPDKEDKLWVGTYAEGFRAGQEAAERRAAALEAENREERAQRQMAEAEVARLWEAISCFVSTRGRHDGPHGVPTANSPSGYVPYCAQCDLAYINAEQVLDAALAPQAGQEAEGPEEQPDCFRNDWDRARWALAGKPAQEPPAPEPKEESRDHGA